MLDIQTHKSILIQILKEIYNKTSLGPMLGFKGGTAVYLFYDLPRFSVDLDFDLLNDQKVNFVFKEVQKILQEFGKLKEAVVKKNTIFFLLSYQEGSSNIKIEISKRNFGSHYEVKKYLGLAILTMKKDDIAGHKLVALLERKTLASRDLFDIWFFLKNNWKINEEIIKLRTGMGLKIYLKKCLSVLDKIPERHILQGIGELLDEKTKEWVKKNLKKDLLFLLKLRLQVID